MELLSYYKYWKDIEIGDRIIAENLQLMVVGIGLADKGDKGVWRIFKKTEYEHGGYFWVGNMVFTKDHVGEDDIYTAKPCPYLPNGLKLKMYIGKKRRPLRALA